MTFSRRRPNSPSTAPAQKMTSKPPLMSTHACQRFSNVQNLPRSCPMSCTCMSCYDATFQTSKCSESSTPHEKVHSSKNEHGAPVNLHIRKRAKRTRHFVQACAVEMHMDISQGNFCASRRRQKPQATRSEDPDLTAALYSPQWTPCLGNHEKWIFFFGPSSHVPHPYSLSYLAGRLVRALSMPPCWMTSPKLLKPTNKHHQLLWAFGQPMSRSLWAHQAHPHLYLFRLKSMGNEVMFQD